MCIIPRVLVRKVADIMTINISEILANPSVIKEFKVEPEFDVLDLKQGSYPISQKNPFILTVSNAKGKLHIKGDTEIRLMIPCDRCLDEVEHTFQRLISVIQTMMMTTASWTDVYWMWTSLSETRLWLHSLQRFCVRKIARDCAASAERI